MSNQQRATERARSSGIDAVLRKPIDAGLIPGVVALAANQDGIFYQSAFGRRAVDKPAAMTANSVFRIASMTKAITATAAMQLVEQGRIGLDQPMREVLPIIGEVRLPERNVPRAMLIGTLIVLVLYVALNAVFLHTAPIDKLAGQLDVARISGSYIFGEFGGRIVGAMICFGLISSISAMMWIGPRVMMTMGEDLPVLRAFARRSTGGAPAYAILFQLTVASLMLFTRSFEAVLDFIQFALLFCSFFTVLGVIKLRITKPDLPRPYRTWGYPVTPVVFLLVTAFMMYYLLTERPLQSSLGVLIMISGLLIYAVFRKRTDRSAVAASPSRE